MVIKVLQSLPSFYPVTQTNSLFHGGTVFFPVNRSMWPAIVTAQLRGRTLMLWCSICLFSSLAAQREELCKFNQHTCFGVFAAL